jgi:hypothetical protein
MTTTNYINDFCPTTSSARSSAPEMSLPHLNPNSYEVPSTVSEFILNSTMLPVPSCDPCYYRYPALQARSHRVHRPTPLRVGFDRYGYPISSVPQMNVTVFYGEDKTTPVVFSRNWIKRDSPVLPPSTAEIQAFLAAHNPPVPASTSFSDILSELKNRPHYVSDVSLAQTIPVAKNVITLVDLQKAPSKIGSFHPSALSSESLYSPVTSEFRRLTLTPQMDLPNTNHKRNIKYLKQHLLPPALFRRKEVDSQKCHDIALRRARDAKTAKLVPQMNLFPNVPIQLNVDDELSDVMSKLIDVLGSGINVTHNVDPDVKEALAKAASLLSKSSIDIPPIMSNVGDNVSNLTAMISVISCFYHYYHTRSQLSFVMLLTSIGYAALRSSLFTFSNIKEFAVSLVSLASSYVAEGSVPHLETSTLSTLAKSFAFLLSAYLVKGKDIDLTSQILKFFSEFHKSSTTIDTSLLFIIEMLNNLRNYVALHVLSLPSERWLTSNNAQVDNFLDKFNKIVDSVHLKTVQYTPDMCNEAHSLWLEGLNILKTLPKVSSTSGMQTTLSTATNWLLAFKKKLEGMNLGASTTHPEPYCICVIGAPNAGKTMVLQKLSRTLGCYLTMTNTQREAYERDPSSIEYSRAPDSEFMDGYRDQLIYLMDEYGQATDVEGCAVNQYFELIRVKNIFTSIGHMAALEDKGNVRITPQLIILSSNRTNYDNLVSIVEPDAVTRRFDMCVYAIPKREYCTEESLTKHILDRRFDSDKFPTGVYTSVKNETMLDYYVIDFSLHPDDRVTGVILTYDQIIENAVKGIELNELRFMQFIHEIDISVDKHRVLAEAYRHDKQERFDALIANNPDKLMIKRDIVAAYTNLKQAPASYAECLFYYLNCYGDKFFEFARSSRAMSIEFYYNISSIVENHFTILKEHMYSIDISVPQSVLNIKQFFLTIYDRIRNYLSSLPSFILSPQFSSLLAHSRDIVVKSLPIFGIVGTLVAASGALKYLYNMFVSIFYPERFDPQSNNVRRKNKKQTPSRKPAKIVDSDIQNFLRAQGSFKQDDASIAISDKICKKNTYELTIDNHVTGLVTFITSKIIVMPRHYALFLFVRAKKDPSFLSHPVILRPPLGGVSLNFVVQDFLYYHSTGTLETLDTVLVHFKNVPVSHTNIVKYFCTSEEVKKYKSIPARLVIPSSNKIQSQIVMAKKENDHWVDSTNDPDGVNIGVYPISTTFMYDAETRVGNCGALLYVHEPTIPSHKILGMHVAGSSKDAYGISCVLTQDDILDCLTSYSTVEMIHNDVDKSAFAVALVPQFSDNFISSKFKVLGKIADPVHQNTTTKIIPSVLHNSWREAITAPAVLFPTEKDGVLNQPFDKALAKYAVDPIDYNVKLMDLIVHQYKDDLVSQSLLPFTPRIYSFDESVFGVEGTSFGPMASNTSPGYPYIHDPSKTCNGKKDWICDGAVNNPVMYDNLRQDTEMLIAKAKKGIRTDIYFCDSLKDERKKFAKVYDPRMFNVGPMHYFAAFRQYFGALSTWFCDNRINNGFVVGLNPYSPEWDFLAKKLNRFGPASLNNKGSGDYSSFDAKHRAPIMKTVLKLINMLYNDGSENCLVREILFMEAYNSKHINYNVVYEWMNSLPSGHPFTTIINNLLNNMYLRYCWVVLHSPSPGSPDLNFVVNFNEFVYLAVQGDDNNFAVHPRYMSSFTESKIAVVMATLGHTYTSDVKGAANTQLRNISEITFLKRTYRYEPYYDRYCGPLSLDTILEMPYWTKKSPLCHQITEDNVNTAMRELALHDESVFDLWAPKIMSACTDKNVKIHCTNRRLLLSLVDGMECEY